MRDAMKFFLKIFCPAFFALTAYMPCSLASDWPMWGADEGRRFSSDAVLAENLAVLWTRQLQSPERAWPFQYEDYYTRSTASAKGKLSFDVSYEAVYGRGRLFVPSMVSDNVTAYEAESGNEIWRFYAEGPVRFAPAYWEEKVYFVSDDGYLYCLDAGSGELLWKFMGSFRKRSVLGNNRLVSIWPARGAPVVSGGVVYFASGILPFEGIFVHAVCADTGRSVWTNSVSGSVWALHQHGGAWSFGGPSPQGYLAVSGDRLIVPGGRTPPAVYDKHTGELLYFRQSHEAVGKGAGGYRVHAQGNWFFNHGMLYSMEDGAQYGLVPGSVLTEDSFVGVSGGALIAYKSEPSVREVQVRDRLAREAIRELYELEILWTDIDREISEIHFKSAGHIGVSRNNGMAALIGLDKIGVPAEVVWEYDVEGEVWSMFPAGGKLFVVTREGKLYCFGEDAAFPAESHTVEIQKSERSGEASRFADSVIAETQKTYGYAFASGVCGDFLEALAEGTELHIVAFDADADKSDRLRRKLFKSAFYGARVAVINSDLTGYRLPPYLADLIVIGAYEGLNRELIEHAYGALRPYGGVLYAADPAGDLAGVLGGADLPGGHFHYGRGFVKITREGPLPGAGRWTHQYGDVSNRTYSEDELVKPPLGALWFGSTSNLKALPRHHLGPIPQVAGGRLIILGVDTISARCVYTGRELWSRDIPGIGHPFTSLSHEEQFLSGEEVYMPNHPGANFIGSPYVSVDDGIYVIDKDAILRLNPADGRILTEFRLPQIRGLSRNEWGHIMLWEDLLIATVDPQMFDESKPGEDGSWNATSSSVLLAMNRFDGRVLWARRAQRVGFRHNAITAGNGRIYAVDGLSSGVVELLARRGMDGDMDGVLLALDIKTGGLLWERKDAFGTWLGYYEDEDILLQGGRHGQRRPLSDEPTHDLTAHAGATGEVVWRMRRRYHGPLALHRDMIISGRAGGPILDPATGRSFQTPHPITGEPRDFSYHRYYGCGTLNASPHLIMFRSGAGGFTDLMNFGGTGNFGGFKAGCTNNLVAADGVLNAPDYTRTCTCSYQLQTSLGLVHTPDAEMWTLNRIEESAGTVKSIGVNFGAPGNRREDGVLWLEYPKLYAGGPDARVKLSGNERKLFRNHSSWIENPEGGYPWVASYGVEGVERITLELVPASSGARKHYDVTLFFAEPRATSPGERKFDIFVQGVKMAEGFDVLERAGGQRRVYKVKFTGVPVQNELEVRLSPGAGSLPAVISGVEVVSAG